MSVGSATAALVSPREIFLAALDKSAIQIVLMHNHPSGDPSPSAEDDAVTKRVAECGALLASLLWITLLSVTARTTATENAKEYNKGREQ